MATLNRELTEAVEALPSALNPLALSLNENPFPPLPAVRSALIESIDAANRYPEYLPQRLRSLIAGRVGVRDEQVVIGVGATGVILQVLHAVTSPGEKIVMTSPTFDGYPIFAQMAGLDPVTVPLDAHGHHDLDAVADAAADARVVVLCRPHNPTGTLESADEVERFLRRVPVRHRRVARRGLHRVRRPATPPRRRRGGAAFPECRGAAHVLEGVRPGGAADRLRVRRARAGPQLVDDAAAIRHRPSRVQSRSRLPTTRNPTAATYSADHSGAPTACAGGCGRWASTAPTATPTSCTCPRRADPGARCSTRPVFRSATSRTAACGSRSAHATPPVRC